jgi:hypothetical protein
VSSILLSKTFDNGVICASEQSLVVVDAVYDQVVEELKKRGAYIMSKAEAKMAGNVIIQEGRLNANVVGQRATKLAGMFGFQVPKNTRVSGAGGGFGGGGSGCCGGLVRQLLSPACKLAFDCARHACPICPCCYYACCGPGLPA